MSTFLLLASIFVSTDDLKPIQRGTFYVDLAETLEGEPTEVNYCKSLVTRMLILHGFKRSRKKSRARFVISGTAAFKFLKVHEFKFKDAKILLEYQYEGSVEGTVLDRTPPEDGTVSTPLGFGPEHNGRRQKEDAEKDIRRRVGTGVAMHLVNEGPLANAPVVRLIRSLHEGAEGRTVANVVDDLVALGSEAVPYLIDVLLDSREVKLPGTVPGQSKRPLLDDHVADHVLSRLFGQKSNLSSDSDRILTHIFWTQIWEETQNIPKAYRLPRPKGTP